MNIVVEKQPKCLATLRVEIPADTVRGSRDRIVGAYASKARVPGFRPGKAPRAVIEKRFEKQIAEELNEELINEAYREAIQQEQLKVLEFGAPAEFDTLPDGGLAFVSRLTLAPAIELPEYKGIKVTIPPAEVPEEEFEARLEAIRQEHADFQEVEGRPVAMDDFAVIDYRSAVDGRPTDEFLGREAGYLSGREGFWIRLAEQTFLPGFAAAMAGMNAGETREITITVPEDFPIGELRGKEMVFTTALKEIKTALLPELDDEFAARLAPGKTMDEISGIIRENMAVERKRQIEDMKADQIMAHLNRSLEFELPEDLVLHETQDQADDIVNRGVEAGMSEQEIADRQGEIFASAGQRAVHNLRSYFILREIAEAEGLAATDQEVGAHIYHLAQSKQIDPRKLIKQMKSENRLPSIRQSITTGKVIDFLVENADFTVAVEEPAATTEATL